ncbi:MAG: hypothetical protein U0939_06820 [Pirellulales bacterium]
MFRAATVCCALLFVASLAGCGPSGPPQVVVKGKLVQKGAPLPVPRADIGLGWVQLELHPAGGDASMQREVTKTKEDGTFEFLGEGSGIRTGDYRLVVLYFEQGPPNDKLGGAFSAEKSPIKITVPADKGAAFDLGTIDLDSPPK